MDWYSVLGVSRAAAAGEIDRAYRRLVRRYHPGVNPGDPAAAEKFRQVQAAFEVLGDERRRHEYERGASRAAGRTLETMEATVAFEGFDFSARVEGGGAGTFSELFADVFQQAARRAAVPDQGAPLAATLRLSFEDGIRGGASPLSIVRQERCPNCAGDGRVAGPLVVCPECGGQGGSRWARGHMVFTRDCETCGGAGQVSTAACPLCRGAGVSPRSEVVTLTLPPGIEPGTRVAVPGRGHASRSGQSGDLYVTVEVADHPFFHRDGADLHLTLPLAVHEAALGARVDVPTLDGRTRLRIPPGTASGQRFRLRGRGVPAATPGAEDEAGDLIVTVQIVLPPVRDERSRELLREFGRLNDEDVRQHLFGETPAGK